MWLAWHAQALARPQPLSSLYLKGKHAQDIAHSIPGQQQSYGLAALQLSKTAVGTESCSMSYSSTCIVTLMLFSCASKAPAMLGCLHAPSSISLPCHGMLPAASNCFCSFGWLEASSHVPSRHQQHMPPCTVLLGTAISLQPCVQTKELPPWVQVEGAFTQGWRSSRPSSPHSGASTADSQSGEGAQPLHQPAHCCAGGRRLHGSSVC